MELPPEEISLDCVNNPKNHTDLNYSFWLIVVDITFDLPKRESNHPFIVPAAERLAGFHYVMKKIFRRFNNFSSGEQITIWRIRQKGK
jgi:hypothetical protein